MRQQRFFITFFAFFALAAGVLLAFSPSVALAAADADALASDIQARNDRIIDQLSAAKSAGDLTPAIALKIIQTEMSPILNFQKITRRAMGKFWKKTSDEEKVRIAAAFQNLLEHTYANVLTKYKNQKVKILGAKTLADGDLSVLVEVRGDAPVMIEYVFSVADNGAHLVSDIKVEKISLIGNYRRQFKSLISAGGVEGLLKKLEELARAKSQ